MPVQYKKISPFDSSFQLVRTNPKLTGNLKITVDSKADLWLNSIEANSELAKDQYKKYPIDIKVAHEAHVYNFFNKGKTESKIIFDLNTSSNLSDASRKYEDQFDFSNYFSGARYLASKFYEEKFSYLAPIYLDQQIPEFFVIFKIPGASNYPIQKSKDLYPFNKKTFTYDMFKEAEIIKTFDLTEASKLGKYLNDILDNPMLPKSPMRVSFQQDQLTSFKGLSTKSGTYTEAGENLHSYYKSAQPIIGFEENMTLGFERNSVLHPFILNLEFLFDDVTSEAYDINRYVGFYCNLIELEKLEIDLKKHSDSKITTNTPNFKKQYKDTDDVSIQQENENGVDLFFKPSELDLRSLDDRNSINENVFFSCLRDQDDFLYLIKGESINRDPVDMSMNLKVINKKLDLGKFFGPDELFFQEKGTSVNLRGNSYAEIVFTGNLSHLDSFKLYHNNGSRVDSHGSFDIFIGADDYDLVPNIGSYYSFYDYQNGDGDQYYFNVNGTTEKMVSTIANMLNSVRVRGFKAYSFENRLFIKANSTGNNNDKFGFMTQFENELSYNKVKVFEISEKENLHNIKIDFRGGGVGYQVTMDAENYTKIKDNISRLLIKTKQGWSRILSVSKYASAINEDSDENRESRLLAINQYDNLISLQLEADHTADIQFGIAIVREYFKPRIGILSLFNIKDFDFDRISSEYSKIPSIDLYKDFYVPPGEPLLMTDSRKYTAIGTGKFQIGDIVYSSDSNTVIENLGDGIFYTVTEGDCFLIEKIDLDSLTQPLYDETEQQLNFNGFSSIKSTDQIKSLNTNTFKYRDRFINGILNTEYDFNFENFTEDYSAKSKMQPYISKWALLDSKDIRDNPYRLNIDLAFGVNNFTPDHFETVPNSDKMTHEWFYIESKFNYNSSPNLLNQNKYYFDSNLKIGRGIGDTDSILFNENGFEDYFTYTPIFNETEVGPAQYRYSTIKKSLNEDSCFFKGINFRFKEVSPLNTVSSNGKPTAVTNSKRFQDYKFSTILKVVEDNPIVKAEDVDPIKYTVIEHRTFKWITLVIEIRLSGIESIDPAYLAKISGNSMSITTPYEVSTRSKELYERFPSEIYNSIHGDYRVSFPEIEGNVSNLTYAFMYYAKDKKFNSSLDSISTIKLGNKMNFSSAGIDNLSTNFAINRLDQKYFIDLQDEISNYEGKAPLVLILPGIDTDLIIEKNQANNTGTSDLSAIEKVQYNKIFTSDISLITISGLNTSAQYQIPSSSDNYWDRFINFQIRGGKNYYENLFKYISFAFVKKKINSYDSIIKYETYDLINGGLVKTDNDFYLEIDEPEFIDKGSLITTEPKSLDLAVSTTIGDSKASDFPNRVGYNLFANDITNEVSLNRYSGEYEVIFKTISCFNSSFNIPSLNDSIKFANVQLNNSYVDLFEIKNFNHIKVSDSAILSLANDSKYDAKYPLIGETPIGHAPYFLMSSNWDYGFHKKYSDRSSFNDVAGTLRIGEDTSFVSKLVNLPNTIELSSFQIDSLEISLLNNIFDNYELIYEEGPTDVTGILNLNEIIVNYLANSPLKDSILNTFRDVDGNIIETSEEFYGNLTKSEYIKTYVKQNVLNLYKIESIEFFRSTNKGATSQFAQVKNSNPNRIDFISLTDSQRSKRGFMVNSNIEINKLSELIIKFKISKPVDSSLLISPKIKIKLI